MGVGGRQLCGGKCSLSAYKLGEKYDYLRASGVWSELVCGVGVVFPPPPSSRSVALRRTDSGRLAAASGGDGGTEQGCGGVASLMTKQSFSSGL